MRGGKYENRRTLVLRWVFELVSQSFDFRIIRGKNVAFIAYLSRFCILEGELSFSLYLLFFVRSAGGGSMFVSFLTHSPKSFFIVFKLRSLYRIVFVTHKCSVCRLRILQPTYIKKASCPQLPSRRRRRPYPLILSSERP